MKTEFQISSTPDLHLYYRIYTVLLQWGVDILRIIITHAHLGSDFSDWSTTQQCDATADPDTCYVTGGGDEPLGVD